MKNFYLGDSTSAKTGQAPRASAHTSGANASDIRLTLYITAIASLTLLQLILTFKS